MGTGGAAKGWAFLLLLLFLPGLMQALRPMHPWWGVFWGAGVCPRCRGAGSGATLPPPTPFWAGADIPAPDPIMAMRSDILLHSLGGRGGGV